MGNGQWVTTNNIIVYYQGGIGYQKTTNKNMVLVFVFSLTKYNTNTNIEPKTKYYITPKHRGYC